MVYVFKRNDGEIRLTRFQGVTTASGATFVHTFLVFFAKFLQRKIVFTWHILKVWRERSLSHHFHRWPCVHSGLWQHVNIFEMQSVNGIVVHQERMMTWSGKGADLCVICYPQKEETRMNVIYYVSLMLWIGGQRLWLKGKAKYVLSRADIRVSVQVVSHKYLMNIQYIVPGFSIELKGTKICKFHLYR